MTAQPLSSERGSAAIEFAVSSIVLAILIFGCIALAMASYTYEVINQYARDASRYAIVHGNNCKVQSGEHAGDSCSINTGSVANTALMTYLNHQIYPGINGPHLQVATTYTFGPGATTCDNPGICNGPGDQVTVTVTYPYLYRVPFIPSDSFTMRGTSTMVISQ